MKLTRMATVDSETNLITNISVWLSPADAPTWVAIPFWLNIGDNINKYQHAEDIESIDEAS